MRQTELHMWAEWQRAAGNTEKTIETRTNQIRTLCRSAGLDDPAAVTAPQMIHWLSECPAGWTRRTYWASARAWCRWLAEMGIREDDPSEKLPHVKQPQGVPRPVAWWAIEKILTDPPGLRAYAYTCLAAFGGLRCIEIARIRAEHLDLDRQWFYPDGKGGQTMAIPLHPAIARLSVGMPDSGYWFPGADHGHVRPKSVSNTINNALGQVGSKGTAHGVRHAYATKLLHNCHNTRVVQLLCRHSSLSSTQIYAGVDDDELVRAVHSLGWTA